MKHTSFVASKPTIAMTLFIRYIIAVAHAGVYRRLDAGVMASERARE
jgi:hypothetical protein